MPGIILGYLGILTTLFTGISCQFGGVSDEELFKVLERGYDTRLAPRTNDGSANNVTIALTLKHIHDLDVIKGELETTIGITLKWRDPRLTWDPKQTLGNLRHVYLPPTMIWLPYVTVANSIEPIAQLHENLIIQTFDGNATWMQTYQVRSACHTKLDTNTQECALTFMSWVYDDMVIDLWPEQADFDAIEELTSNEWGLTGSSIERRSENYTCCEDPYAQIVAKMSLKQLYEEKDNKPVEVDILHERRRNAGVPLKAGLWFLLLLSLSILYV